MKKLGALLITVIILIVGAITVYAAEKSFANGDDLFQYWATVTGYPEYVCGVWSADGTARNLVIAVTEDDKGNAGKEEILAMVEDDTSVSFTYAKYSYAELRAIQDALTEYLRYDNGIYEVGVDETDNCVSVGIDTTNENSKAFMQECFEIYGDKVVFLESKGYQYVLLDGTYESVDGLDTYDNPATAVAVGVNKGVMSRPWMLCLLVVIVCFAFGIVVICQKRSISNGTVTQTDTGNVVVESAKISRNQVVKAVKNAEEAPDDKVYFSIIQELKNDKEI
ncbi:MAG: hypothetical protein E7261_11065 [Lachnospiraceae bacterium]|nr:hypothetical protein [Lachnospiraceae bacterium]